ncbi:MAG: RloB family protein [Chlamydiales bacterium]
MKKRLSIRSYRKPDALYSPLDLVVCEGETEVDYLCELARNLRIHVHICKGGGTDPKSIVDTAKRKSKEDGIKYDKIFCVFDRDNDLSSFLEAIELCKSKKFIPIISNPCFELWPYLHFQMRESGFGSPQQMLKALKKLPAFSNYDKDGVQIYNSTHHLIEVACKHASSLISKQHDDPKEDPFTTIHILIKRFQTLKEEQNYFGKNRTQLQI